jgi:hypothetical protein
LLDFLYDSPVVNIQMVAKRIESSFATASRLVEQFQGLGLLRETTGQKRNRQFEYEPYLQFWKTAQDDYGTIAPSNSGALLYTSSKENGTA